MARKKSNCLHTYYIFWCVLVLETTVACCYRRKLLHLAVLSFISHTGGNKGNAKSKYSSLSVNVKGNKDQQSHSNWLILVYEPSCIVPFSNQLHFPVHSSPLEHRWPRMTSARWRRPAVFCNSAFWLRLNEGCSLCALGPSVWLLPGIKSLH